MMEESNDSADQAETSGEVGDISKEAGKVDPDLKGDGQEVYGPWLLVKRKKAVAKSEGHRKLNQGVGMGPGKGYSRNFEAVNRQVYKSCDKPTFRNRHGSDVDSMEVGHRVSHNPSSIRERKKKTSLSMD